MALLQEHVLDRLKQARDASLNKQYHTALQAYLSIEKQVQDDPENLPLIWIEIGWNHYYLNNFHNAVYYFEKAIESGAMNERQMFDCLRLLGFSYAYSGNADKAVVYLQEALLQNVEEIHKKFIYFELGKILFIGNLLLQARPYLEKALELFPEETSEYRQSIRYYLGFIAFSEGQYKKAEILFLAIVENASVPENRTPGYLGMAYLFYKKKEYPALIDICEKIANLDNDFYDKETLAFFLCKGYMALKMWDELALFLNELMKQFPEGRYKAAYPVLEKALRERTIPETFPKENKPLN